MRDRNKIDLKSVPLAFDRLLTMAKDVSVTVILIVCTLVIFEGVDLKGGWNETKSKSSFDKFSKPYTGAP